MKTETKTVELFWDDAVAEVRCLQEEMNNWYENMGNSEGLMATEKYQTVEDCVNYLDEALSAMEDFQKEEIKKIGQEIISVKYSTEKYMTRPKRLSIVFQIINKIQPIFEKHIPSEMDVFDEIVNNLENVVFPRMY